MSISVQFPDRFILHTAAAEMARLAGGTFPVADRVAGAAGEGFDLRSWYAAAAAQRHIDADADGGHSGSPTHLIARAADGFQAIVPFGELSGALLQFADEGPARLYVPDGSSQCLNVKRIVALVFQRDPELGEKAVYGFVNELSAADVAEGLKRR